MCGRSRLNCDLQVRDRARSLIGRAMTTATTVRQAKVDVYSIVIAS